MLLMTNKGLESKIKYLEKLVDKSTQLLDTIKAHHNNAHVLLLEDMTENLINKLFEICQDDTLTVVLYSKDGHRIEIKKKEAEQLAKRKNFF